MKQEELYNELRNLISQYDIKRNNILKKYCDKNNPFQIGDRFSDTIGEIIIDKIDYVFELPNPTCSFTGRKVLKNGQISPNIRTTYRIFELKTDLVKIEQRWRMFHKQIKP